MLDARVYRTAFLPALVALFIAAFALADRPEPGRSDLPSDAFSGERAFGQGSEPEPQSLRGLGEAFPDRAAGSRGDLGIADLVEEVFASPDEDAEVPVFTVRRTTTPGRTAHGEGELTTVTATRPGSSSRRIVVLAHRDGDGLADLSGTAVLLELARVLKTSELRKTVVLVSTSGATTGFEGARAWARENADAPIDGVIVLGDLAGTRIAKPWAVSWPAAARPTPLGLERTVQAALRRETGSDAGGPRALGQWARRAIPLTLSAQGPIGAAGLPAVLISESGELGPRADEPVLEQRLDAFGRAALSAIGGVDAAGPREGEAFGSAPNGIVTLRNVLADWSVRLVVGTLLLPATLAALDAFFRARRRRVPVGVWLGWLAVAAVPLPAAWLWLRGLGATGLLEAPDGPIAPDRFVLETAGYVSVGSALVAGALACWCARVLAGVLRDRRPRPAPGADGLAVATGVWLCAAAAAAWVFNPYAAALLLPAVHLWLFAASSWSVRAAIPALVFGLIAPILVFVHYGFALDLGPIDLAWGAALSAAAGWGLWTSALFAGLFAGFAGTARAAFARRKLAPADDAGAGSFSTRGPLGYAGPGSLGGTESALRR